MRPERSSPFRACAAARIVLLERDRGFADSPLEEAVLSELVSESPNSLLAGKIQGILFVWASECDYRLAIQPQIQWLTAQFPTRRNREFISP
jgi:hypothetical protein